jgi:competence protein ComFC
MLTIVHKLLDVLFPPRDTEQRVRTLTPEVVAAYATLHTYESIRYLLPYQNESIQALIKENKYHHNETAATLLAKVLEQHLSHTSNTRLFLIPIPLSPARKKSRGYNQVESILHHLPPHPSQTLLTNLLFRTRDTTTQTTLKKQHRLANMTGAFATRLPIPDLSNSTVLIIDDVVTTGATLKAAQAALAPHLPPTASIICLALAH